MFTTKGGQSATLFELGYSANVAICGLGVSGPVCFANCDLRPQIFFGLKTSANLQKNNFSFLTIKSLKRSDSKLKKFQQTSLQTS
jgi:hypothetical protein